MTGTPAHNNSNGAVNMTINGGGGAGASATATTKDRGSSGGDKKKSASLVLPSLPLQTESAITSWLYKNAEASLTAAHNVGVLSPLWLWTHVCYSDAQRTERSATKAANLARWLLRNKSHQTHHHTNGDHNATTIASGTGGGSHCRIAIVAPHPEMLKRVKLEFTAAAADVSFLLTQEIPAAMRRREEEGGQRRSVGSVDEATPTPAPHRVHTSYHHVIFVLPEVPSDVNVQLMRAQEPFLCANLAAASTSFTLIADASWLAPAVMTAWKGWRGFVEKLQLQGIRHEHVTILGSDDVGEIPPPPAAVAGNLTTPTTGPSQPLIMTPSTFVGSGLVGPKLPVCCSVHHNQFTFFSGLQMDVLLPNSNGSSSFCKQICKKPHHCFKPDHMCGATCHPAHDHRQCPFACRDVLPCGHVCLMECGEPCNCLEVITEPLLCNHQVVAGLDPVTQQAVYTKVPHTFHGFCSSKNLPCVVDVPTICATCLGPFHAPCHQLQRAEHTMEHRTVSCDSCKRIEADIRSEALAEVLVNNEQKKRDMKADLAKSVHEQRKGAASGVFKIGARIVIRDAGKAIPPFDPEADFPNVPFVDYDAEDFYQMLNGSMGIIVSQHVDVDDPTELRSLVRLSSGKYVLVGDGGMEYIRADVSAIIGGNGSTTPMLLLAGPQAPSTTASNEDATTEGDDSEEAKKWKAQVEAMIGSCFLLMNTVTVPRAEILAGLGDTPVRVANPNPHLDESTESSDISSDSDDEPNDSNSISLCEVVVKVLGHDPQGRRHFVHVECTVLDRQSEQRAMEECLEAHSPQKRPREEEQLQPTDSTPPKVSQQGRCVLRFSVQARDLDPIPFNARGADVFVTHPQYQVTSRELLDILKLALQSSAVPLNEGPSLVVSSALEVCQWPNAIAQGEALRVEAIINAPLFNQGDVQHGFRQVCRGPLCLLSSAATRPAAQQGSFRATTTLRRRGGGPPGGRPALAPAPPTPALASAAVKYVVVPLAFVAADEVTNAMNRMDDEAQRQWVLLVADRLQQQFEARALRNDELAFQAQLQMPPLPSDEQLRLVEQSAVPLISCPTPIPTKEVMKQMESRGKNLPSGVGHKLLEAKDAAERKMSLMRGKKFALHLFQQTKDDMEAMRKCLEAAGSQLKHHQQK